MRRLIPVLFGMLALLTSCSSAKNNSTTDTYFIGTNLWYAGRAATTEEGKAVLTKELDSLHALGINNLRILATKGESLEGLKTALDLMQERGMGAVLFLGNAWEWSHGFANYLEEAGAGPQPRPATDGYWPYMKAMAGFSLSKEAQRLNQEWMKEAVTALKGHSAIYSWQICNEPRCFSRDKATQDGFVAYIHSSAALIKSLDPLSRVSTGNEGSMGCEENMELCRRINDCQDIDYVTIHIWPYNWSWAKEGNIADGADAAVQRVGEYIDQHLRMAKKLGKKVVIEEFGYPRDGFVFTPGSPTTGRDKVYGYVFQRVLESAREGGLLLGCNFWAWGGSAQPRHERWQEGDPFTGDPFQEQQGLNSVFLKDASTIALIKEYTGKLASCVSLCVNTEEENMLFTPTRTRVHTIEVSGAGKSAKVRADLVTDLSLMAPSQDTVLTVEKTVQLPGSFTIDLASLESGFYQVRLSVNGEKRQSYNIGIDPETICSPSDTPEDFHAFWESTLTELAGIPMQVKMTPDPAHSNEIRESYRVAINSLDGGTMGGLLCMPVAEGKYPVIIDYMGYGADVWPYDPSSRPGHIQFLVSVRGQGIFREPEGRWIDRGLASKDSFYYRGAYADAARAVDFIKTLPKADTTRMVAMGESQGGALTWVAGSLRRDDFQALCVAVPFLNDYRDYYKIVSWPMWEVMETADKEGLDREKVYDMLRYFDVKNFTPSVKADVLMGFGLQDPVCPPHTNFAGYNLCPAPKSYVCLPTCGHGAWDEPVWQQAKENFINQYTNQ